MFPFYPNPIPQVVTVEVEQPAAEPTPAPAKEAAASPRKIVVGGGVGGAGKEVTTPAPTVIEFQSTGARRAQQTPIDATEPIRRRKSKVCHMANGRDRGLSRPLIGHLA